MDSGPFLIHSVTKDIIPFNGASVFTIGRSCDCNLDISAIYISRKQCRIENLRNVGWVLYDESRFKTTRLNGEPIEGAYGVLKDGDKITFSLSTLSHEFYFHCNNDNVLRKKRKLDEALTQVDLDVRTSRREDQSELEKVSPLDLLREMATQSSFTQLSPVQDNSEELGKLRKENVLLDLEIKKSREISEANSITVSVLEMENKNLLKRLNEIEKQNKQLQDSLFKTETKDQEDIRTKKALLEEQVYQLHVNVNKMEKHNTDLKNSLVDAENEIENLLKERCCKIIKFGSDSSKNREDNGMDTLTEVELSLMKEDLKELSKRNSDLALNLDKITAEKELFSNKVNEIMESELYCSICSDLIYQAVTLQCRHTFCLSCIEEWKKKKRDCPVCRTKIKSQVPCLIIDNLIDKVTEAVGGEVKTRREELIKERTAAAAATSAQSRGNKRRRSDRPAFQPYPPPLDPILEQIDIGYAPPAFLDNLMGHPLIFPPHSFPEVVDLTNGSPPHLPFRGFERHARRRRR